MAPDAAELPFVPVPANIEDRITSHYDLDTTTTLNLGELLELLAELAQLPPAARDNDPRIGWILGPPPSYPAVHWIIGTDIPDGWCEISKVAARRYLLELNRGKPVYDALELAGLPPPGPDCPPPPPRPAPPPSPPAPVSAPRPVAVREAAPGRARRELQRPKRPPARRPRAPRPPRTPRVARAPRAPRPARGSRPPRPKRSPREPRAARQSRPPRPERPRKKEINRYCWVSADYNFDIHVLGFADLPPGETPVPFVPKTEDQKKFAEKNPGLLYHPQYGYLLKGTTAAQCIASVCKGRAAAAMQKALAAAVGSWKLSPDQAADIEVERWLSRRARRRLARQVVQPTIEQQLPPIEQPTPGVGLEGYYCLIPGWNAFYLGNKITTQRYALRYGTGAHEPYGLTGDFIIVNALHCPDAIPLN